MLGVIIARLKKYMVSTSEKDAGGRAGIVYILADHDKPEWLDYPYGFRELIDFRIFEVLNWGIMNGPDSIVYMKGLRERYPSRELFPFAFLKQNDDIACWSKGEGEKVFIVHDFASPGWEQENILENFGSWLRFVVDDFIDWEPIPEPHEQRRRSEWRRSDLN